MLTYNNSYRVNVFTLQKNITETRAVMENSAVILTYVLTGAYFIRMFYQSTKKLGGAIVAALWEQMN